MNITMFGPLTWHDTWYSRHHLTVGLAARHRVTVVADPVHLRTLLRHPGTVGAPGRIVPDQHGVMRFEAPGWLPHVHGWPPLRGLLYRLRARAIQRVTGPSLSYLWHPNYREAVAPLTDVPLVYHCYDKYDRYINAPAARVRQEEERIARRAVLCVAASTSLGTYLEEIGARRVLVLRHGVDADLFKPGRDEPEALKRIPRPRLGVVARLNEALDLSALRHVATSRRDWSIVLVGGVHFSDAARAATFAELSRLPNVHHVGHKPRTEIPNWLCGFDVGLACYDLATWGPYNQPIKLYEYLACGLPVASSDIQAARELGDLVERSASSEEWVGAIERALSPASPALARRRLDFAQANTWGRRVDELDRTLRGLPGVDSRPS